MTKQIEVSKTFNASIEMVWKIWTDPDLVKRWWGPEHFTSSVAKIDFMEGGRSIVNMIAPKAMGGQVYYSSWLYVKIVPLEVIEFIQMLCDKNGERIEPKSVGMPADFPPEVRTVVIFKMIEKSKTAMTVTEYAEFGSISNFAQLGLEQSMEKMERLIG
ncbi:MAG: SRPBCC domain-containing protein [Ferruginibacter sp.]